MSYATNLQMPYPSSYGPSTLLSDDLVWQSTYTPYYPSSSPYFNSNLLTYAHRYDHIGVGSITNYRMPTYGNWTRTMPAEASYTSMNDIREYSQSLGTVSNTTTASSNVHSIEQSNAINQQHSSHLQTSSNSKIADAKQAATYRSLPELSSSKLKSKISHDNTSKDPTPPAIPEHNHQTATPVDTQTWINDTHRNDPLSDEHSTPKIEQLHIDQVEHDNEQPKSSSHTTLPNLTKTNHEKNFEQQRAQTYFDSLFDGNFLRKNSTNQRHLNSSHQQNSPPKNEPSIVKVKTTVLQKKPSSYEPAIIKKPQPVTTTYKQLMAKQPTIDSNSPHENVHFDDTKRYRQALQRFRSDRAEQQQRETNESTSKRLNYDRYVRRSVREGSLHNPIKPLPWTDFLALKKGNVYSLNKEEKRDRYNQLRSYSERIRYRNFTLHQTLETARSQHRSMLPIETIVEETQSTDDEQGASGRHSSSTIRPLDDDNADISEFQRTSRASSSTN